MYQTHLRYRLNGSDYSKSTYICYFLNLLKKYMLIWNNLPFVTSSVCCRCFTAHLLPYIANSLHTSSVSLITVDPITISSNQLHPSKGYHIEKIQLRQVGFIALLQDQYLLICISKYDTYKQQLNKLVNYTIVGMLFFRLSSLFYLFYISENVNREASFIG